jgi:hypothetical protein
MNCTEFENVVVALARNEGIARVVRRAGLTHAARCVRCARRLASETMLSAAIAAAVAEDATKETPLRVGTMLVEALRERKVAARRLRRTWLRRAIAGAIAAVMLIGAVALGRKVLEPRSPENGVVTTALSLEEQLVAGPENADEVMTDFIPVVYDPVPIAMSSLLRVEMPREAMTVFGLPVNEDRMDDFVQADLLLDEYGQTRAVRFVE